MRSIHSAAKQTWVWPVAVCTLFATLPAAAQTVIVDDADPGFSVLSADWTWSDATPGHWGTGYQFRTTTGFGNSFGEVEFRPDLPTTTTYEVAVWYTQGSNRAPDAPFTIHYNGGSQTIDVDQRVNGQQWFVLGSFPFAAGTAGRVTLSNDAAASVVIADAVRFVAVGTTQLTMAVSPPGGGTTIPAVGSYVKDIDEVVNISATPAEDYLFDQWEVSGGSPPTDPNAENTTVTVDQTKTVTANFAYTGQVVEFRGFWADAFHAGFKSTSEIDTMISWALAGNYNAIIPEVLAFHDTGGGGHGAYWNSSIVPKASDISGGIDPLAYLVQQAHANGIEVHPWLVAFRVCASWPPSGNPTVSPHPEWLMVPLGSMGGGPATVGGYYVFDPGSPDVQSYLMSIVRELCTNYEIDGIHWDYIRYTQTDAGYPADTSYDKSTLRRFQNITGYVGTPPDGLTAWDDFRRRTVTEVVRRAMFEIPIIDNPRQPLRHSAALVTWYPANTNFHLTRPYYDTFCDWEYWQSMGYLDATVPMCYFDEGSYPVTYRAWVDNSVTWANNYGRHTYIGPGIYLNTIADSVTQMLYARGAGAHGFNTYSYRSTNDGGVTWSDWYAYVAANVFTDPAAIPSMPWRDPGLATEGTLYGRVFDTATGDPIDDATIDVPGRPSIQADGNGYYLVTRIPASAGGTTVTATASQTGYSSRSRDAVIFSGSFSELNIPLGDLAPGDWDGDGDVDRDDYAGWPGCMTGPNNGPVLGDCDVFDLDTDGDVDLLDSQMFELMLSGL